VGVVSITRRPVKSGSAARSSSIGNGEVPSSASWIGRSPVTRSQSGNCTSNNMRELPISTVLSPSPVLMRRRCSAQAPSLLR
jgi:hypothetical protein